MGWALVGGAASLLLLLVLIPDQFRDPFTFFDDYPVLLGQAEGYYPKTLSEGRWINWLWTLRPAGFDPVWLFAAYVGFWCLAMAVLAAALLPPGRRGWVLLGAPALVLSPSFAHLYAFATLMLVPAIALGFVLMAWSGPRARERALLLLVAPSVMVHGALAYLLLTMAILLEARAPGLRRLVRLCLAFGVSFALGVLAIFALNFWAHGVFGLETAEWRRLSELAVLDPVERGLERLRRTFAEFWSILVGGMAIGWLTLGAMGASALLLLRENPRACFAAFLAGASGLGLTVTQILASGVTMPERGFFFLWPALVAPALLLVGLGTGRAARAVGVLALIATIGFGALHWRAAHDIFAPLMAESRAIAAEIGRHPPGPVLAAGKRIATVGYWADAWSRSAWHIWLEHRLEGLTGREVAVCPLPAARCAARDRLWPGIAPFPRDRLDVIAAMPPWPSDGSIRVAADGTLLLRLPDRAGR